jgi:ParB/RepB/Spo0J family partition protein
MEFKKIHLEKIKRQYLHVKKEFVDKSMDDLILSIKELGLIQPITIHKNSEQEYDVIDGNRRLHAYSSLNQDYPKSGFEKIECIIHEKINEDIQMIHTSMEQATTPTDYQDITRTLDVLWDHHPYFDILKKKFGISENILKRFLRYQWWPESIQSTIYSGEISSSEKISIDYISKGIDLLNWPANENATEDKVIMIAKKLAEQPLRTMEQGEVF